MGPTISRGIRTGVVIPLTFTPGSCLISQGQSTAWASFINLSRTLKDQYDENF